MSKEIHEDNVKLWFAKYGWHTNPFTFKIYPEIMVGYKSQTKELLNAINADSTFSLVIGETGAGKTNLLRWIANQSAYRNTTYYLPKPPSTTEAFFRYLKDDILRQGIFSRIFAHITPYNIHYKLQKKLNRRTLLILDEAHEAPVEVLMWVRTILDHVQNLVVIAAGLPHLVETLKNNINTLYDRATTIISLESLSKDESLELIQKRILAAGGKNLEPFTSDALIEICEKAEGFPRKILRLCNNLVLYAIKNNKFLIDKGCVLEYFKENQHTENKKINLENTELTKKQKAVLNIILKHQKVDPNTIVQNIDLKDYKSENHAIRSVNNILKRLIQNRIVERQKKGRTYIYSIRKDAKKILS